MNRGPCCLFSEMIRWHQFNSSLDMLEQWKVDTGSMVIQISGMETFCKVEVKIKSVALRNPPPFLESMVIQISGMEAFCKVEVKIK